MKPNRKNPRIQYRIFAVALSALTASLLIQGGRTQQITRDGATPAASATKSEVNWIKDYATAATEAKKSGKLLFVTFRCER